MSQSRRGSVFLFILAVLGVLFALAYGLLSSSSMASNSAFESEPQSLADQAAQEGINHAIGLIHEEFADASKVGLPTQFTEKWRTHFWPIDTHDVGINDTNTSNDAPRGEEMTLEDRFENDVHVENLLTELYCDPRMFYQAYEERGRLYAWGYMTHPGTARWHEPGVSNTGTDDPVTTPLSFHLTRPGTTQVSVDPAPSVAAADVDDAAVLRYDSNLRPTNDDDRVRYRLRYAVAVEPIDGHILTNVQGEYAPGGLASLTSAAPVIDGTPEVGAGIQGTPDEDDLRESIEVDRNRAERYVSSFAEMVSFTAGMAEAHEADSVIGEGDSAELGFQGLGYSTDSDDGWAYHGPVIAGIDNNGVIQRFYHDESGVDPDEPNYLLDDIEAHDDDNNGGSRRHTVTWELTGPIASYHSFGRRRWQNDSLQEDGPSWRYYTFQPFGKAPTAVADPTAWDEGYTDTPWRVNVPIMAPRTWSAMLWGYLPQEVKTPIFDELETYTYDGLDDDGNHDWDGPISTTPVVKGSPNSYAVFRSRNIFKEMANEGYFDQRGNISPGDPYPGTLTHPGGGSATDWDGDEGGDILTAEDTEMNKAQLYHLDSSEDIGMHLWSDVEISANPVAGGMQEILLTPNSGDQTRRGFYWDGSYWLDIANSFRHTMALAGYAWMDHAHGRQAGDSTKGKPYWFNVPNDYFQADQAPGYGTEPNDLCRDWLDLDGDGLMDTSPMHGLIPSAFDSPVDLDHQFLRNLGEQPVHYARDKRPPELNSAVADFVPASPLFWSGDDTSYRRVRALDDAGWVGGSKNIKHVSMDSSGLNYAATTDAALMDQAGLMELIVNDFRMSFFGASPQYVDSDGAYSFRPMDLDDDGTVRCSCYPSGYAAAEAMVDSNGDPINDPDGSQAYGGPIPDVAAGDKIFSLTGYFVFQKSRYYRITVRGELFDDLREVPVAQSNVEAAYVVDPDGDMWDLFGNYLGGSTTGMSDSHVIYQRKLHNVYRGTLSHAER